MEMIKVRAYFIETVVLEGWSRNATDLFTDKKAMLKPIVYHYFNFVFAGIKYEFKVMDDEQKLQFDTNTTVDILFDAKTKKECSFLNKKQAMITEALKIALEKQIKQGASFLSCVSLVQKTLKISLLEAKDLLLKSDVYDDERKKRILENFVIMQSDFEKENL